MNGSDLFQKSCLIKLLIKIDLRLFVKLFVSNFMDRSVTVYDLTEVQERAQWNAPLVATMQSVATEALTPQVLVGKQFFYDAADDRLAFDNYLSCATCHNDGEGDTLEAWAFLEEDITDRLLELGVEDFASLLSLLFIA